MAFGFGTPRTLPAGMSAEQFAAILAASQPGSAEMPPRTPFGFGPLTPPTGAPSTMPGAAGASSPTIASLFGDASGPLSPGGSIPDGQGFDGRFNQGPPGQGYGVAPEAVTAMRSGLLRQASGPSLSPSAVPPQADVPATGFIVDDASAASPKPSRPLSFGPLPGTSPAPSRADMPAPGAMPISAQGASGFAVPGSDVPASAPDAASGGGFLSALSNPRVYNTLLGIGQGLLSTKGFGPGIALGTAQASKLNREQAATDLAGAEYGLKARKLQQETAGQNQTVELLTRKGVSRADAVSMVSAAAAGNREALNNALNNVVPKRETPGGYTLNPDGSAQFIRGGPQDPAMKEAEATASARGTAAGKPDDPFNLSPGQTRYDAAGTPIVAAPEKRPESFDVETKLRTEFTKNLGSFNDVHDGYGRVIAATKQREANPGGISPASDIGLIFGYMKMLDPGSVVREGEYATAKNATGVPDRVLNAYNKALSGEFLSDGQRRDFLGQAAGLYDTARKTAEDVASRYRGLAPQYGANPDRVTYLPELPAPPQIGDGSRASRTAPVAEGAVRALQSDPTLRDQFEAKYGPGSADRYLGGR